MRAAKRLLIVVFVASLGASFAYAQADDAADADTAALAIRQEGLSGEVRNLEQKLQRLIQELHDIKDPQADRLARALKRAREIMLRERMENISALLRNIDLDRATGEQGKVIDDLIALLETLNAEDEFEKLQEQIKRLEQWRQQINELSREEWQEKRDSEKLSDLDKARQQVAGQIDRLKDLIREQSNVRQETEQSRQDGTQNFSELSQKQGTVKNATSALAKSMADAARQQASSPTSSQAAEPGQKPLNEATKHQGTSQQNLKTGKPLSAEKAQEKALDAMEKALTELQSEKERLDNLSPENTESFAEKQDDTSAKTGALADQMAKAQAGESGSQGGGESSSQSAQQSLQNAQQSMTNASQQLRKQQAKKAAGKQQDAYDQLQEARKDIDKQLEELREEQRDALLAKLIAMFRGMLDQQIKITLATAHLDKIRSEDKWNRAQRLQVTQLSNGEATLAGAADSALKLMEENSSPVVFPHVVSSISDDLTSLSQRLQNEETGHTTNAIQKDVEKALEDLIGALEMAQSEPPPPSESQSGQGQGGQSPKPPLVSPLAEIKLLRNLQVRVNSRTKALHEQETSRATDKGLAQQKNTLTERQQTVTDMTKEFIHKLREQARTRAAAQPQIERK